MLKGDSKIMNASLQTIKNMVDNIGFTNHNLISINDLSNEMILELFKLANRLQPWYKSRLKILSGKHMATLFFQPSTRTRLSFETAMNRLGGTIISETTPLISSSAAKEESLSDMIKVVSQYANIIVLRHPNSDEAKNAVTYSDCPVINGAFGHEEHPTQALLDLYTIWQTIGKIEGLKVCIATPDLIHTRSGHSIAYILVRFGAKVYLLSKKEYRTPNSVMENISKVNGDVEEVFDLNQKQFNEFIYNNADVVYLPGCSAPKGEDSEKYKQIMGDYFIQYETIEKANKDKNKIIYVTHPLPRRQGEIDLRIDKSSSELYFKAIAYSVAIRMALILAILGFE